MPIAPKSCAVAALALLASGALHAAAPAFPARPIRMVIPFASGGPNDVIARIIAQKLTDAWGQAIVIDNRPGAGGNIGCELVARAAPDGYTLALVGMHFVVNPSIFTRAGYDPLTQFAPVTLAAVSPVVIAANPALEARTVQDLAQLARRAPLNYGSPGTGTAGHLAGELFAMVAGSPMQHIAYKGAAPAVIDLLGGQVRVAFTALPPVTPHVRAGKLRAIAVTTLQRSASLPDVPTVDETGFPGFAVDNMYGVVAPAGTPQATIAQLRAGIAAVVKANDSRERLVSQGYDPVGNTPAEFGAYLRTEVAKWAKVVKQAGIKAD